MAGIVPPRLERINLRGTKIKVSSTLDSSSGKKNLLDGSNETCWSSTQGLPQWIHLIFPTPIPATHFAVTFQGGFAGTTMKMYVFEGKDRESVGSANPWALVFAGRVFARDINARQVFELPSPTTPVPEAHHAGTEATCTSQDPQSPGQSALSPGTSSIISQATQTTGRHLVREVMIEFEKSSDPWGRITVYELEMLG